MIKGGLIKLKTHSLLTNSLIIYYLIKNILNLGSGVNIYTFGA